MTTQPANLSRKFDAFVNTLSNYPTRNIVFFILIINVAISCVFSYIISPGFTNPLTFDTLTEEFIIVVIAAPAVETYFIQTLILGFFVEKFHSRLLAVGVSAVVFGLLHYYSLTYIVKAFISGTLYALLYLTMLHKKKQAFLYVWLTHSLYNLIGFIINNYVEN
jgi:hypothetical protein